MRKLRLRGLCVLLGRRWSLNRIHRAPRICLLLTPGWGGGGGVEQASSGSVKFTGGRGGIPTGLLEVPYLPALHVLRTGLDVHGHGHDHLQPGLDSAGLPVGHGGGPDQLHLLQPVHLLLALRQAEALPRGAALAVGICNTQLQTWWGDGEGAVGGFWGWGEAGAGQTALSGSGGGRRCLPLVHFFFPKSKCLLFGFAAPPPLKVICPPPPHTQRTDF